PPSRLAGWWAGARGRWRAPFASALAAVFPWSAWSGGVLLSLVVPRGPGGRRCRGARPCFRLLLIIPLCAVFCQRLFSGFLGFFRLRRLCRLPFCGMLSFFAPPPPPPTRFLTHSQPHKTL